MVSELDASVCKSAVKLFIEFACVFFASGSDICCKLISDYIALFSALFIDLILCRVGKR